MRGLLMFVCLSFSVGAFAEEAAFRAAMPVWPVGRQAEKNLTVGFRAVVEPVANQKTVLRLTASTVYRAFVNGTFAGYGPARGPQGWFRVDEWDLTKELAPGKNVIAIEVAGYNINSYYLMNQPSFLQAEVVSGDKVLAATGAPGQFAGQVLSARIQKIERYSFQRVFAEAYRLTPGADAWRKDPSVPFAPVTVAVVETKKLLPRRVPFPAFTIKPALGRIASGTIEQYPSPQGAKPHQQIRISDKELGYSDAEVEAVPSAEMKRIKAAGLKKTSDALAPDAKETLSADHFVVLDFGTEFTGFLGATITCKKPARLYFAFDEILTDAGDVNWQRMGCVNVVEYQLAEGAYAVESFEPYSMRYLKMIVAEGECAIGNVHIRQYANPDVEKAKFSATDERLNRLFKAGVETFTQNAVDIFMDCPSRERAGWLCDSFFTSRVAKDVSGKTVVEKNYLENFLLREKFEYLPDGMLPMCYPSDHYNGSYIPNWAMWFVVQLEEYQARSGDRALVAALKPKIMALLDFFKQYRNSDGLLEKLPSWVFVEWSKANDFVQDVNYPSNMLYAGVLSAVGRMYAMPELLAEADKVRETVRKQSYDSEFFVDNALRKDGKLEVTRNRTEVCQYFAFFFDVATPKTHPALWRKLRDQFGPKRAEAKAFPEIYPANSFIGNMLRVEILSRQGRCQQILDESIDYLLYMADRTGTLWENATPTASCNHGFASHIVHTLYRDVLGLYKVDTVNKKIAVRFGDVSMPSCEGAVPVPEGLVSLKWRVDSGQLKYHLEMPAGYAADIENLSGKTVVKE